MAAKPEKILVVGNVKGRLNEVFGKVAKLNSKHGPFECLLCVGSFFGEGGDSPEVLDYISGQKKVPVPTFFIGANDSGAGFMGAAQGGQLCENLTYLGSDGVYTLMSGLKIAYMSGEFNAKLFEEAPPANAEYHPHYTRAGIGAMLARAKGDEFKGVDVLLTNEWPMELLEHVDKPMRPTVDAAKDQKIPYAPEVSQLILGMRPRYHFAAAQGLFYERPPYRNLEGAYVTRFLAIADFGNANKAKALYALNLVPMNKMDAKSLSAVPANATACPYKPRAMQNSRNVDSVFFGSVDPSQPAVKRQRTGKGSFRGRRGDDGGQGDGGSGQLGEKRKRDDDKALPECWFCLASPDIDRHLIVSIGKTAYVALAKGGLVEDHLLVLPSKHVPSTGDLSEAERDEMASYKKAIRDMLKEDGKEVVMFERNIWMQNAHLHVQAVPVPEGISSTVRQLFEESAHALGFEFRDVPEGMPIHMATQGQQFFAVELPSGDKFYHVIRDRGFPMQFGRQVLAEVLGMPERVEWKECAQPKEQETAAAQRVRTKFLAYDPNSDSSSDSDSDSD